MYQRRMFALVLIIALVIPLIAACGEAAEPEAPAVPEGEASPPVVGEASPEVSPEDVASPEVSPEASPEDGASPEASPEVSPEDVASPEVSPEASPEDGASPEASPEAGDGETPAYTLENPPAPENVDQASQYSGQTVTYYGDSVGVGAEIDQALAQTFSEATGINIEVVPKPESTTEMYSQYQRFFQAQSPDLDVMMVDVIYPSAFAQHLVDLSESMSTEIEATIPALIENSTIDGAVVTMPWFADFGLLYYRTDLLEEYGFDGPPETWTELEEMARTIQEGERQENPNFAGFVFQGNAYEGLTCNALEWVASVGGGTFVNEQGEVTINNPQAAEILNQARGWVGTIAPQGVTNYQEEDARLAWQGGNAMFMRNWPYAYAAAQAEDSAVAGNFDIAPLPHGENEGESVGTIGGWGIGVSKYSDAPEASIEWTRYITSPEVQAYRAIVGAYLPARQDVAQREDIREANPPLRLQDEIQLVARPSRGLGDQYNQGSTIIFQSINQILRGQDAAQVLPNIEQQLQRLVQ